MERASRILCDDKYALFAFLASPLIESAPIASLKVDIFDQDTYEEFMKFLSTRNPKAIGLNQKDK